MISQNKMSFKIVFFASLHLLNAIEFSQRLSMDPFYWQCCAHCHLSDWFLCQHFHWWAYKIDPWNDSRWSFPLWTMQMTNQVMNCNWNIFDWNRSNGNDPNHIFAIIRRHRQLLWWSPATIVAWAHEMDTLDC